VKAGAGEMEEVVHSFRKLTFIHNSPGITEHIILRMVAIAEKECCPMRWMR